MPKELCGAISETGHECDDLVGHSGDHICTEEHYDGEEGNFVWNSEDGTGGWYLPVDPETGVLLTDSDLAEIAAQTWTNDDTIRDLLATVDYYKQLAEDR